MTVPVEVALLGAALTSVAYQLHNFHDPLLAYAGITQLVMVLYAFSALAFLSWLRTGGGARLAVTLVLMVVANLIYEAAYPLVMLHVAAAFFERRRWTSVIGPIAVTIAFVLPSSIVRSSGAGAYGIDLAPDRVASTLGRQLSAPVPLANYLDPFGPRSVGVVTRTGMATAELRGLVIGVLLLPLLLAAARVGRSARPNRRTCITVIVISFSLLALPSGLVAVAKRYQTEVRWGVGYLPAFFGYVAIGLLGSLAFWIVSRPGTSRRFLFIAAASLSLVASINAVGNARIASVSRSVAIARDEFDEALRAGLLDDTPTGTMLLFDREQISEPQGPWIPGYDWAIDNWIYAITGRRMRTLPVDPSTPLARQCQESTGAVASCRVPNDPVEWIKTASAAAGRWILLAPLSVSLRSDTDLRVAPAASAARLAIRSRAQTVLRAAEVRWRNSDGTTLVSKGGALTLVRQHGEWSLMDIAVPRGASAWTGAVVIPASA